MIDVSAAKILFLFANFVSFSAFYLSNFVVNERIESWITARRAIDVQRCMQVLIFIFEILTFLWSYYRSRENAVWAHNGGVSLSAILYEYIFTNNE